MDNLIAPGDVIGGKYKVESVCSNSGGMGTLVFVEPVGFRTTRRLVLKYCKAEGEEARKRFVREVRLLSSLADTGRVAEIVDSGLEHDPPYFVMPFYEGGDLTTIAENLRRDPVQQERTFLAMVECVESLHGRGVMHRDIKPQNFLRDGEKLRVSDLGLSVEAESGTAMTRSSVFWGTHGYLPPEYTEPGGFRNASVQGDIFMLGKSFYNLLTGRDPTYLQKGSLPDPVFYVVESCCSLDSKSRFRTTAELKQKLVSAYDVLLGRLDAYGAAHRALQTVREDVAKYNRFSKDDVRDFMSRVVEADVAEREILLKDLKPQDFAIFAISDVHTQLDRFMDAYGAMVDGRKYGWSFAERIASNMAELFKEDGIDARIRARALDLAIRSAIAENRFSAMDTCTAMIVGDFDDGLAFLVASVLQRYPNSFVASVDIARCASPVVRQALRALKESDQGNNV